MKPKLFHRFALIAILLILPVTLVGCGNSAQGKVVDEIMQHLAAHDTNAAFEHMSSAARDAGVTAEGLDAFIQEYGILVDGYNGMSVSNMSVSTNGDTATTDMTGSFNYEDGSTGQFSAQLLKEGEVWMVTEININK